MKRTSLNAPRHKLLVKLLWEKRVLAEVSQAALGEAMGRPQSYVSAVENGIRGLDLLQVMEFTRALDIPFPEFVTELEERFKKARV
jgi:transcriptional regulator with XRE-family HTH domain